MKQLAIINPEQANIEEAQSYRLRETARAVVFNVEGNVAILHATKNLYYKLPGGGLEDGEDHVEALRRECLEEIGFDVEVITELGQVEEYRKLHELRQVSYCYAARTIGEQMPTNLMQDEVEEGFETVWLPLEKALAAVRASTPTVYAGQYMVPRDIAILEATLKTI